MIIIKITGQLLNITTNKLDLMFQNSSLFNLLHCLFLPHQFPLLLTLPPFHLVSAQLSSLTRLCFYLLQMWVSNSFICILTCVLSCFGPLLIVGFSNFLLLLLWMWWFQAFASPTSEAFAGQSFNWKNSSGEDQQQGDKEDEKNYSDFSFQTQTKPTPVFQSSSSMSQVVSTILAFNFFGLENKYILFCACLLCYDLLIWSLRTLGSQFLFSLPFLTSLDMFFMACGVSLLFTCFWPSFEMSSSSSSSLFLSLSGLE